MLSQDTLKIIITLVSGGLAGTLLNLVIGWWVEHRQQKRLSISIGKTSFALPDVKTRGGLKREDLQVTFKDRGYKDLVLYSIVATNIGKRSLEGIELHLLGDPNFKVLFVSTKHKPFGEFTTNEEYPTDNSEDHVHIAMQLPKLAKDDKFIIHILADSLNQDIECITRNTDNVRVILGTHDLQKERETRTFRLIFYVLSLLAGAAVIIGLFAVYNFISIAKQEERISEFCVGKVSVSIDDPKDGDHVPFNVAVRGTSTIHNECRYVFIIARNVSKSGQYWYIADIVQVDTYGRWRGKVFLDKIHVEIQEEVELHAIVNAEPKIYKVDQPRQSLPGGARSNTVHVRRIE
jgi:hypothetical protein